MPVDSRHPQYDKYLNRWKMVRDCDEGASTKLNFEQLRILSGPGGD